MMHYCYYKHLQEEGMANVSHLSPEMAYIKMEDFEEIELLLQGHTSSEDMEMIHSYSGLTRKMCTCC